MKYQDAERENLTLLKKSIAECTRMRDGPCAVALWVKLHCGPDPTDPRLALGWLLPHRARRSRVVQLL